MAILVLFDIDKTLVEGLGGHSRAFSEAFKSVYGVETSIDIINHYGMTDQQIILDVLKKNGLSEQATRQKLKRCMEEMTGIFTAIIDRYEVRVLEGVPELLEGLQKQNILIGLVTGNLEQIARSKLKKAGLSQYFKVGGFGSDDINRTALVKLAMKRAEHLGFKIHTVFLFGDTPYDIKAGKEAQVKTVGVATGAYSKEELEDAGADVVLENLKDTNEVLRIVL